MFKNSAVGKTAKKSRFKTFTSQFPFENTGKRRTIKTPNYC